MAWRFSWYVAPLVVASVTTLVLSYFAYRNRSKRTAPQVVGILIGCTIWAGADAISLMHTSEAAMVVLHDVRFLGSTLLVFSVFLFALEYTNRERWLKRPYVAALAAPFAVTVVLAATETTVLDHGLIRTGATVTEVVGLRVLDPDFGPWFWVNAAYSYGLLALALAFYVVELVRTETETYRNQTAVLALSLAIPWLMNGLFLTGTTPVDLTGAGLAVTGVLFYTSLFWLSLLDLVPIARGTVLEHVDHGVMVVDPENTVVDCNARMVDIVGVPRDVLIGTSTDRLYADYPEIREQFGVERDASGTYSMELEGTVYHYEVEVSPIYSRTDRYLGRTILVQDVSDRVRRQRQLEERTRQLERQNERLDEFASIVSHDLRNPLSVADGYLGIAREHADREELEIVAESLDRMDEIIEDVLTLARETDAPERTDPVDVSEAAAEAWQTVDAPDGTLEIDCECVVLANRSRLRQLFENLFRNAYDHGPADTTVVVRNLDGRAGFSVEDDGPGIEPDAYGRVFDEGYSTADGGTGLGLSIVRTIADGHGWSVRLTEGHHGGARFEFTGVTVPKAAADEA